MAAKTSKAKKKALQRRRERGSRIARQIGSFIGGPVERRIEQHLLKRSWTHFDPERLQRYLVRNYQNPVINVQSILARHELIRELYGDAHDLLMDDELRWAADKHQALRKRQSELQSEMSANFSKVKESQAWRDAYAEILADGDRFADLWTEALRQPPANRLTVVEAACGSANDYRFFRRYGLASLLDYTGFDLTSQNIGNARLMYPGVDFRLGDVQDIDAADHSYDWAVVHDLLEHLSPAACDRAISELCRVTKRGVLISFFRMDDIPEHKIEPRRFYHFNLLSKDRIHERFAPHCPDVRFLNVKSWFAERTGFDDYYNSHAWTLIARH